MRKTIALIGALDTKGVEYLFVKHCIEDLGLGTLVIDVGLLGPPAFQPEISREEVASAAGIELTSLTARGDRGEAIKAMSRGAALLLPRLYAEGRFQGVMALGGTSGTCLACAAMQTLPIGIPKVMVSTVAGTDVSPYLGTRDIVMIPSIVDVVGINRISREIYARAAGAVCGMVKTRIPEGEDRPMVVASMFGNTTPAVEMAKGILEKAGYEVLVFQATGTGGKTMESLMETGLISGVLDMTVTEWADELVGGVLSAGPSRLEAAATHGIPAIVVPGCLDMVNFWEADTVPPEFANRRFYQHNPSVTLMRTTPEENQQLGEILATKLNASLAPVSVLLPLRGLSKADSQGGPFWWPEADQSLFDSLKQHLRDDIPVIEMDNHINDETFARRCAEELIENMNRHWVV